MLCYMLAGSSQLHRLNSFSPPIFPLLTSRLSRSWAIDNLFGSVAAATHPGAVDLAYSDQGGAGAVASPRIGAIGGLASPEAASAFDGLAARMAEAGESAVTPAAELAFGNACRCWCWCFWEPTPTRCTPPLHLLLCSGHSAESPTKVHSVSTATLQSSSWAAFLSYALFPPTYLAGPIVTASDFYQQVGLGEVVWCIPLANFLVTNTLVHLC